MNTNYLRYDFIITQSFYISIFFYSLRIKICRPKSQITTNYSYYKYKLFCFAYLVPAFI